MSSGLHIDSVRKSFGENQVLTDVFLSCKKGEIVGLLGRNGSGKSTLLKIIFGSLNAENKFVRHEMEVISNLAGNKNRIKYLPQDNFLPSHVKVSTTISLFCDKENANIISSNELIQPLLHKKCRHLSGGEQRLLEIFLIVHSNANYILIDEPFNGIAPLYKENIKSLIKKHAENKGFIITDHDYRNILDIATKTILIHDGGTKEIKHKDELKYWGYLS